MDIRSGPFNPGDIALWHSGSSMLSWPPDGFGTLEAGWTPTVNTVVMIVARPHVYGAIVLTSERGLWWCPIAALRGEPSGSSKLQY